MNLRQYNKFVSAMFGGSGEYDFSDKGTAIFNLNAYMLDRTQSMFKWSGLPDTIPPRNLELILQTRGFAAFYKTDAGLFAFSGGLGGEPDPYYMPTIVTISNPALNLSVNAKIDDDCVVIPNDSMYLGLLPLFTRYATLYTESDISTMVAVINSRIPALISSDNDSATKSAEKYLDDIRDGKLGVISSKAFFEGIKTSPYGSTGNTNILTNLIEMTQYIKASWYNELGLNANYNMKRESINSGESQLNNDALLPLVDDMLRHRKLGAEKVNSMFGTSISVEFSSSWEDNIEEIDAEQKHLEGDEGGAENGNSPIE